MVHSQEEKTFFLGGGLMHASKYAPERRNKAKQKCLDIIFIDCPFPASISLIFQQCSHNKILNFIRSRTRIVGVQSEHADHHNVPLY